MIIGLKPMIVAEGTVIDGKTVTNSTIHFNDTHVWMTAAVYEAIRDQPQETLNYEPLALTDKPPERR